MTTAAKTTSKLLVTLKDPTGRKRAHARHQLMWTAGAAVASVMLAGLVGMLEFRRRRARREGQAAGPEVRTAGTTTSGGYYRSRHGEGASPMAGANIGPVPTAGSAPIDKLAASAEQLPTWGADEPGFRAHLGFGVGGSIPADPAADDEPSAASERVGDSMPTAGGDALGGTVRGGEEVGYADEIVTGAGEAISNSTTPAQNGHGTNLH